jgi:hypothetical protein
MPGTPTCDTSTYAASIQRLNAQHRNTRQLNTHHFDVHCLNAWCLDMHRLNTLCLKAATPTTSFAGTQAAGPDR